MMAQKEAAQTADPVHVVAIMLDYSEAHAW